MFSAGLLAVIMSLVGLKISALNFIYNHGVITLIIQLILLFGGMIILFVARTGIPDEN